MKQPASIAQRFDDAALTYDQAAVVQLRVAEKLFALLQELTPPHHIIEVGCGTGFLTQSLCKQFPNVPLLALDIAPTMIALCQNRLQKYSNLHCKVEDAQTLQLPSAVDWLGSSLSLQWFDQWPACLQRWAQQARTIAFSVPLEGSFSQWRDAHLRTGQRDGLHPLPDEAALQKCCASLGTLRHFSIQTETLHHLNALDFARTLRAIGASQPHRQHSPASLRRILRALPNGVDAEYRIAYVIVETT